MPDQQPQGQPLNPIYCDAFNLTTGPYGAYILFGSKDPAGGGQAARAQVVVGMSIEHLKAMSFILTRQVLKHEKAIGKEAPLPDDVITDLVFPRPPKMSEAEATTYLEQVRPAALEQWRQFWQGKQPVTVAVDGQEAKTHPLPPG